jgi:hypothetical protein
MANMHTVEGAYGDYGFTQCLVFREIIVYFQGIVVDRFFSELLKMPFTNTFTEAVQKYENKITTPVGAKGFKS